MMRALTVWEWVTLRLLRCCRHRYPIRQLVRYAVPPDHPILPGEVWLVCPVCGRILGKRPELPRDAAPYGVLPYD